MGAGGLEPPQSCDLRILSPLRLPFRHAPSVTATLFGDSWRPCLPERGRPGKPQTTICETVDASYGSWRRVLEPGQLHRQTPPPWLASAALHQYQVGCPTTEAAKGLPPGSGDDAATHEVGERLWAGWISLAGVLIGPCQGGCRFRWE